MAAFAIYTYKFRDVENIGVFQGQDAPEPLPTLEKKQNFLQQIFSDAVAGVRPFECSVVSMTDSETGRKTKTRTGYGCQVVWEKDGMALLMVSNPYKSITRHQKFQKIKEKDEPWCHVLIDNRYGREFIAIEKNPSFNTPDAVALILEQSLRARLTPHHVTIEIKNQYEPDAFWDVVEQHKMQGISEVSFCFSAPNNPWATNLIGCINNAARGMKARPTTTFSSPDGEPIILEPNNGELKRYVTACAKEGEDIVFKVKGIRSRIHVLKVTNKFVLKQMPDDVFRNLLNEQPELFDEDFSQLTAFMDEILPSKEA